MSNEPTLALDELSDVTAKYNRGKLTLDEWIERVREILDVANWR